MDPVLLFWLGAWVLGLGLHFAFKDRVRNKLEGAWRNAGSARGLRSGHLVAGRQLVVRGERQGAELCVGVVYEPGVVFDTIRHDREAPATYGLWDGHGAIPTTISIAPIAGAHPFSVERAGVWPTGDPELDREMVVSGGKAELLAVLDIDTRRHLRRAASRFLIGVDRGQILAIDSGVLPDPSPMIEDLEDLGKRLRIDAAHVAKRLLAAIEIERVPAVKYNQLRALFRDQRETAEAGLAIDLAHRDADPYVNALGIMAEDRVGAGRLPALLDEIGYDVLRDEVGAELVRRPGPEVTVALEQVLRSGSDGARRSVCIALAANPRRELTRALSSLLSSVADQNHLLMVALLGALVGSADATAEPVLLARLHDLPAKERALAIRVLGAVGTLASVEPLLAYAETVIVQTELTEATQHAIAAIQARAGGGERGALSLDQAPKEEGGLSLADDPQGALSEPRGSG